MAASIDESTEDDVGDAVIILAVPDKDVADHEHFELTWEGARQLRDFLTDALLERLIKQTIENHKGVDTSGDKHRDG